MNRVELKGRSHMDLGKRELLFLMNRVELKEKRVGLSFSAIGVPNEPCGVESLTNSHYRKEKKKFLMNRVELKVSLNPQELAFLILVPNEPCGVERTLE